MKSQIEILNDVLIIRPFVIILLIVTHSFTMYTGGAWPLPTGIQNVWAYGEIAHIAFSFMLETFVFISGYLLGMQLQRKKLVFISFLQKKFDRLILPSIVFSILYIAFFDCKEFTSFSVLYTILNGAGHLWFLPMLFWCFIMAYLITQVKGWEHVKLIFCFMISLFSGVLPLPLHLGNAFYYMFFFYLGMCLYSRRKMIISRAYLSSVIFSVVSFVLAYFIFSQAKYVLGNMEMTTFLGKAFRILSMKLCMIIYSSLGLIMTYIVTNYMLKNKNMGGGQNGFHRLILRVLESTYISNLYLNFCIIKRLFRYIQEHIYCLG